MVWRNWVYCSLVTGSPQQQPRVDGLGQRPHTHRGHQVAAETDLQGVVERARVVGDHLPGPGVDLALQVPADGLPVRGHELAGVDGHHLDPARGELETDQAVGPGRSLNLDPAHRPRRHGQGRNLGRGLGRAQGYRDREAPDLPGHYSVGVGSARPRRLAVATNEVSINPDLVTTPLRGTMALARASA